MSLSNDSVLSMFKNAFVCGFKNIKDEPYCGKSGQHDPTSPAVVTTNGAGPHNVQLFFLAADGAVLHCLPGYWAPNDLLYEVRFVLKLNELWNDPNVSLQEKQNRFRQANLNMIRQIPADMRARSHLQSFDAQHEQKKADSDFRFKPGDFHPAGQNSKGGLKSTVQVIHERMAQRPFLTYEQFDVAHFSDYGKLRYDKKEETRMEGAANAKAKAKKK